MKFPDLAKSRYSCRNYKSGEIEDAKLMQVLEAARIAPSAANHQPWHFIIVKSGENKARVYESYHRDWIKTAPVLIVVCGDHSISWKRNDGKDHLDIDISISIDHITLQAVELGLATCWVCNFNANILKNNLNLPDNIEPVAIIPIGYPKDTCDPDRHNLKRKTIAEIVHFENFSGKKSE
jgi:nitroreductase